MKYLKLINWNLLAAMWLLISFVIFAVPVEASSNITGAKFYGIITVANNGTATTLVSTNSTNMNTTGMISGGYVNSTLSDAAVVDTSGTDVAFMPGYGSSEWVFWVPSADANSYQSYLLYSGNVTGGKIRYFPTDSGMTTSDSASLELGNNFSIEQSGHITAGSTGITNLLDKTGAIKIWNLDNNILAAGIGTLDTNFYGIVYSASGSWDRTFQYQSFTPASDITTDHIYMPLAKVGLPASALLLKIYTADGDDRPTGLALVSASIDPSELTTSLAWIKKSFTEYTFSASTEYVIELSCGSSGNSYKWAYVNGSYGTQQQHYTDYSGANTWTSHSGKNTGFILGSSAANTIICGFGDAQVYAEITPGEHDIQVQADGTNLLLVIDGVNEDSVALAGASVPDNSNDIVSFENGSMLYAGSDDNLVQQIYVGGVLQQDIGWEYAATFTDQSGNSHDATPTFQTTSTDGDVSATLTSFQPVSESKAPGYTLSSPPNFITSTPAVSGNFSTTVSPTFPGVDILEAAATSGGTPVQLAVLIPVSFGIMALSLFLTWLMKRYSDNSQLVKFGAIFILMGICISTRTYDLWMLIFFLIIGVAIMFGARESRIGG